MEIIISQNTFDRIAKHLAKLKKFDDYSESTNRHLENVEEFLKGVRIEQTNQKERFVREKIYEKLTVQTQDEPTEIWQKQTVVSVIPVIYGRYIKIAQLVSYPVVDANDETEEPAQYYSGGERKDKQPLSKEIIISLK